MPIISVTERAIYEVEVVVPTVSIPRVRLTSYTRALSAAAEEKAGARCEFTRMQHNSDNTTSHFYRALKSSSR